ncbi:uncharacterized protein LOC142582503 isoform X4 [Dermacentor variabilis]|uniref:uncharacterized protein LOC142582503 isoform X4 n=1 Tax=Dermacentor variabilis TaxID=34621 RepID=UPI003F5B5C12
MTSSLEHLATTAWCPFGPKHIPGSHHLNHLNQCHRLELWQGTDICSTDNKRPPSPGLQVYSDYVSISPSEDMSTHHTGIFRHDNRSVHGFPTETFSTTINMADSSHFLHGHSLPQSPTGVDIPLRNGMGLSSEEHMAGPFCQEDWADDQVLWRSLPTSVGVSGAADGSHGFPEEDYMAGPTFGIGMSASYYGGRRPHSRHLSSKVEMVYSLLSMLGTHDKDDLSRTLLTMSGSQESCLAMRQSGCLPLLIQLLHGSSQQQEGDSQESQTEQRRVVRELRLRASQALHNVVHAHPDDRQSRREARVLRLLEQIRDFCDYLHDLEACITEPNQNEAGDQHPGSAIAALMKLSFDEEHRHAMCQLGGLQAIAELIQVDQTSHGNTSEPSCVTLRRYAGMALTNLTFGDGTNKALLCSMKGFMRALVSQLHSPSEDLRQVTASVLRNLSWRADSTSRETLREVGAVPLLMEASMEARKEATLKSILSALWNLSAHCTANKVDICNVEGALAFLVGTLTYRSPSKTLAVVENGGGILRNVSSYVALQEQHRQTLRVHSCLQILLKQLKSPSLTVVSNACGTLWNLSAHCAQDQRTLWEMGAVSMLRNLVHSKHKMIAMGSSAALKNLLTAATELKLADCDGCNNNKDDNDNESLPSLAVRKRKALETELDASLSETCDNIDSPRASPTGEPRFGFDFHQPDILERFHTYLPGRMYHSIGGERDVPRSDSRDSIGSTQSEPTHLRPPQSVFSRQRRRGRQLFERYGRGGDFGNLNLALVNPYFPHHSLEEEDAEALNGNDLEEPLNQTLSDRNSLVKGPLWRDPSECAKKRLDDSLEEDDEEDVEDEDEDDLEVDACRDHLGSAGLRHLHGMKPLERSRREVQEIQRIFERAQSPQTSLRGLHVQCANDTVILTDLGSLEDISDVVISSASKQELDAEDKEEDECLSDEDLLSPPLQADDEDEAAEADHSDAAHTGAPLGQQTSFTVGGSSKGSGIPIMANFSRPLRKDATVTTWAARPSSIPQRSTLGQPSAVNEGPDQHSRTRAQSSDLMDTTPGTPDTLQQACSDLGTTAVSHAPTSGEAGEHPGVVPSSQMFCQQQQQTVAPMVSRKPAGHCCSFAHSTPAPSLHEYIYGKKRGSAKPPVAVKPLQLQQQSVPRLEQLEHSQADVEQPLVPESGSIPSVTKIPQSGRPSLVAAPKIFRTNANPPVLPQAFTGTTGNSQDASDSMCHSEPGPSTSGTSMADEPAMSFREKIERFNQAPKDPSCIRQRHFGYQNKTKKTECNLGMANSRTQNDRNIPEEKGKKDERAQEKFQPEPAKSDNDLEMLSAAESGSTSLLASSSTSSSTLKAPPSAQHINLGTSRVVARLFDEEVPAITLNAGNAALEARSVRPDVDDEMMQSTTSLMSDLEGAKPPSVMGDLLSMSMTSSGLSEDVSSNGKGGKAPKRGRVPETVRRALGASMESPFSDCDLLDYVGPPSAMGSIENLSIRSRSGQSDDLNNVNPPSTMDDLSMSGSCMSLNSIPSDDEANSQSSPLVPEPSPRRMSKRGSDMSDRLNAAANMAQVYSRELNSLVNGSMKSSSGTSEMLEHVQPPSVYQDMNEVTFEDMTEMGSDGFASDVEFDDELMHDDDVPLTSTTETLRPPAVALLQKEEQFGDSTENLASTSADIEPLESDEHFSSPAHHSSSLSHGSPSRRIDCPSIDVDRPSLLGMPVKQARERFYDVFCHSKGDDTIDDETFSLISNNSDQENIENATQPELQEKAESTLKPPSSRGPRIVKPINRETIRQLQDKKEQERAGSSPPVVRRRESLPSKVGAKRTSSPKQSTSSNPSPIKHTKASALRASQNQRSSSEGSRQAKSTSPQRFVRTAPSSPGKTLSERPGLRAPRVQTRTTTTSATSSQVHRPTGRPKSLEQDVRTTVATDSPEPSQVPPPLVRQGTFTKESPTDPTASVTAGPDPKPCKSTAQDVGSAGSGRSSTHSSPQHSSRRPAKSASTPSVPANSSRSSSSGGAVQKRRTIPLSPSSHSLGCEEKKGPYVRSLSSGGFLAASAQVQKSGSAASLTSQSSSGSLVLPRGRAPAPPRKDTVPGKLSSLWKRKGSSPPASTVAVNSAKPSIRAAAKSESCKTTGRGELNGPSVTNKHQQQPMICRSSTYEKLTDVGVDADGDRESSSKARSKTPNSTQQQQQNLHRSSVPPAQPAKAVRPTNFWKKLAEPSSSLASSSQSSVKTVTSFAASTKRVFGANRKISDASSSPVVSPSLLPSGKESCRPTVLALRLNSPIAPASPLQQQLHPPLLQSPMTQLGATALSPTADSKGSSPASAVVSPFNYKPRTPTTPGGTRSLIPAPVKLAGTPRCSGEQELQVK